MEIALVGIVVAQFALLWWRMGRLEQGVRDLRRRISKINDMQSPVRH